LEVSRAWDRIRVMHPLEYHDCILQKFRANGCIHCRVSVWRSEICSNRLNPGLSGASPLFVTCHFVSVTLHEFGCDGFTAWGKNLFHRLPTTGRIYIRSDAAYEAYGSTEDAVEISARASHHRKPTQVCRTANNCRPGDLGEGR